MDDEKPMASHESPNAVVGVRDMAAEFAQRQEQKRLDFEEKQERKRQEFESKLEKQKARREWLMLVITVAAVAAAAWTAYEARQARIEARDAATKSFEAQTASMRLDERPYVKVSIDPTHVAYVVRSNRAIILLPYVVTTSGRTPALKIVANANCAEFANFKAALPASPKLKLDSNFDAPMLAPGDSGQGVCSMPNLDLLPFYNLRISGAVFYEDLFHENHITQFCWDIFYSREQHNIGVATQCESFPLKVT